MVGLSVTNCSNQPSQNSRCIYRVILWSEAWDGLSWMVLMLRLPSFMWRQWGVGHIGWRAVWSGGLMEWSLLWLFSTSVGTWLLSMADSGFKRGMPQCANALSLCYIVFANALLTRASHKVKFRCKGQTENLRHSCWRDCYYAKFKNLKLWIDIFAGVFLARVFQFYPYLNIYMCFPNSKCFYTAVLGSEIAPLNPSTKPTPWVSWLIISTKVKDIASNSNSSSEKSPNPFTFL